MNTRTAIGYEKRSKWRSHLSTRRELLKKPLLHVFRIRESKKEVKEKEMVKEIRDLQQLSLDNPVVWIIEKVTKWEEELKEKGWDELHIKEIIRNRIRRGEK